MAITADKKKRRLLLLTRRFPFNRGEVAAESYLENEIGVLSTYFDEVLAVGTEAQPGDAPTCALPGNVTPLALGCGNNLQGQGFACSQRDRVSPFGRCGRS